jgi:hypothetical protein
MLAHTGKQRRQRRIVVQMLHRVEGHENQPELPSQVERPAIALDKLDANARRLRLGARVGEHRSGKIQPDNLHATLRDRDCQPPSSASQFEHSITCLPRLLHIKMNIGDQKAVDRVIVPPIAIKRDRFVRFHIFNSSIRTHSKIPTLAQRSR